MIQKLQTHPWSHWLLFKVTFANQLHRAGNNLETEFIITNFLKNTGTAIWKTYSFISLFSLLFSFLLPLKIWRSSYTYE